MDWREAAAAFPLLEDKHLIQLQLSKEEQEQVLILINRALSNAQNDSSDIAMIALKKLLTQYPTWGEAALLYGICLASDGKIKRALASFEHALATGLTTEEYTYLAQICYRDAGDQYAKEGHRARQEEENSKKGLMASILPGKKSHNVFRDADLEERSHMQAPILRRAPRSPEKAKMASDRERRDVLMQGSTSSNGETPDEEIDVSIPKTPAEKLRLTVIVLSSILAVAVVGLAVWFFLIPWIASVRQNSDAQKKLDFLLSSMSDNKTDPLIAGILTDYNNQFPPNNQTPETNVPQPTTTTLPAATEAVTPSPTPTETVDPATTTTITTTTTTATQDQETTTSPNNNE